MRLPLLEGLPLLSRNLDVRDTNADEFYRQPAEDLMDEDEDETLPPVPKLNQSVVNGA